VRPRRGYLYVADLKPGRGSEPSKHRPVLVIQTDLLNEADHPSTWVVPCTTRCTGASLLRVPIAAGAAGNPEASELMVDQGRAIDNSRFRKELGPVPPQVLAELVRKLVQLGELREPPEQA
jgi:mRNA interferase MazF